MQNKAGKRCRNLESDAEIWKAMQKPGERRRNLESDANLEATENYRFQIRGMVSTGRKGAGRKGMISTGTRS